MAPGDAGAAGCLSSQHSTMKPPSLSKVPELGPRLLSSTSNELAGYILTVLHGLAYLPLVLLPAMQDAHLKLVAVLNTLLCLCLIVGNWLFHYLGIVKVFPKMLEMYLLVLYASMVPVVYLQHSWLHVWIMVYHSGAVAGFMWLTIVLPCWDCFVTESLKDRLPHELWESPAVKRAGLRMSLTMAVMLTLCALVTLPPALIKKETLAVHVTCDYVLVLLLTAVGLGVQWRLTVRLLAACAGQSSLAERDVEEGEVQVGVSLQPRQPQGSTGAAIAAAGVSATPCATDAVCTAG